jgi:hypothetical protein
MEDSSMNRPISDERPMEAERRREQGDGSAPIGEAAAQTARDAASDAAETGGERVARGVDDFADAVDSAASRLSELEHEGLADYAHHMASYLADVSDRLRAKSVDELADDVKRLADRNPALFVLGSVALGIGLSRFAKASREKRSLDGAGQSAEWRSSGEREWRDAGQPAEFRVGSESDALDGRMNRDETGGAL